MADQTALGHTETAPPAGRSQGQARTHAGSPQGREQIAAVEHSLGRLPIREVFGKLEQADQR